MQNYQVMNNDYLRILSILRHKDNEPKHMSSIIRCIFLFKNKWTCIETTEEILIYSSHCLMIDDEYEKLKLRLYGTETKL